MGKLDDRNQAANNFAADRTVEAAERTARIVELRRQRLTWREIADVVGVTMKRCQVLYRQSLAEIPAHHVDEHRAEELLLVDDATADLMLIARDVKVSPRTRIEAWSTIRAWAERKAKLMGLDAPTQVVRIDAIDKEIQELSKELAAMEQVVETADER
jgi:hypothetical protein